MPGGFNPDEYNTVAERIEAFTAKYPEGSLQSEVIELSDKRVVMRGYAYRSRDDERPGIGTSAMPIPATNAMLRNSEIETAETSAWGRALAALGFEVRKGVATKDEVTNKSSDDGGPVWAKPMEPTHANGLIGTVEAGKPPVDLQVRQTPDGPAWGFKLKNGRKSYQVLATGDLASVIGVVLGDESLEGVRVEVFGSIDMIPWDKAGKAMPPYPRINLTKLKTPDWTLPLSPLREDEPEQVSPVENGVDSDYVDTVPLAPGQEVLPLDDEERALVGGVG